MHDFKILMGGGGGGGGGVWDPSGANYKCRSTDPHDVSSNLSHVGEGWL